MKHIPLILISFSANITMSQFKYPETKKCDSSSTYFGRVVSDPYRWLEDDQSEETAEWVTRQNEFSDAFLNQIPYRDSIKERLKQLRDFESVTAPRKHGKYYYYYKTNGLQNQWILYRKLGSQSEEIFLDPNKFSADGTTSLGDVAFTDDGSICAYSISEGGSDWQKIIVLSTDTKEQIGDTIFDVKFSGIAWYKNEGFYYSSYDKPDGSELSAKTDQHKLYFHTLGTLQKEDKVIFGGTPEHKRRYVWGSVSEDHRYLFISSAQSTSGNDLFFIDLNSAERKLVTILSDFSTTTNVIDNRGDTLYLHTNLDAPNNRICTLHAGDPNQKKWKTLLAETENVLEVTTGGGYIFAQYMKDAISMIKQYDYSGEYIRDIELPGPGTGGGFGGRREEKLLYYSFSNYHTPGSTYAFDPANGKSTPYWSPKIDFDGTRYESKQVFYTSKDGTKVPMIITYKKGIKLDGRNPTILYGYGGFNVSLTPSFSATRAAWMEMGGVLVVVNLRGGGEYGQKWHLAGTQLKKQNVFDDFIAAAEFLFAEKYTSREFLAIEGGSNGGLLVGAVMTQRPDLVRVALPAVGVMDMLRYHTFTAGAGWAYDYGTADDSKDMFSYLLGYSPVHNVRSGTSYPATMVTTGDHDDRVVPAHSYKFACELQAKQAGSLPILISIETNAGHGAGTPVSKQLEQAADKYGFTLWNMGFKTLPK